MIINQGELKISSLQTAIMFLWNPKNRSSNNPTVGPYSFIVLVTIRRPKDTTILFVLKSILNTSISDSLSSPNGNPKKYDSAYHLVESLEFKLVLTN